ncbi:MAG: paraquat-inducible protein A [Planctomycetota bacterium]
MSWSYRIVLSTALGVLCALALKITQLSMEYADCLQVYQLHKGPEANVNTQLGYLIEGISLGSLSTGSQMDSMTLALLDGVITLRTATESYSWLFLWASIGFLALGLCCSLWPADSRRFARCVVLVATICLVVGQMAPIMSMTVTSDVPLAGTSVMKHECKSILTVVAALQNSGKTTVATLIVLFSLVTPTLKLLLAMVAARALSGPVRDGAVRVASAIGKWSMADVFVVAILLAIFSLRDQDDIGTSSEAEVGLWFFAAHCILSLVGLLLIARKGDPKVLPEERLSSFVALVAQLGICAASFTLALLFLKPGTYVSEDMVLQPGYRWSETVLVQSDSGLLKGIWRSSGQAHGGADDTMVCVRVVGPDGGILKEFDHNSEGAFELPVHERGPYAIVFDNVGIVRSTARSVMLRMEFRPASFWTW